ncbi:tetratricopeptide repeat protein [Arcobacter sp.]|uniref:tetratricopeptide repeat protein n=1 Tax=unclassified Arcobacter TaxID=2593671 RepID=UPI003B00CB86
MIKILTKISFITLLLLALSACNDNKGENEFKASLPMPEWDEKAKNNINKYWSLWNDAKKDPVPAMKIGYAYSEELHDYKKALEWYKYADSMIPLGENSYFACYALQQLKKYDEAITWCKKAIDLKWDKAFYQLGTVYYKKNDFENALKWFSKAYAKGEKIAVTSIGLTNEKLGNYKEAEEWYKKGVKGNSVDSYHNIGRFYFYTIKNNLKASAYTIALIDTKYTRSSVLKVLQDEWKIPKETIKKGYELQLNSDEFPIKYKGKLDLDE